MESARIQTVIRPIEKVNKMLCPHHDFHPLNQLIIEFQLFLDYISFVYASFLIIPFPSSVKNERLLRLHFRSQKKFKLAL